MKKQIVGFRSNAKLARDMWGEPSKTALQSLRQLTSEHSLSVAGGDLQFLSGKWYVTHSGLLGIARRNRCCGIKSALIRTTFRPCRKPLGLQGDRLQDSSLSRLCRLRRCRSFQHVSLGPWRRDARCRDTSRQSGSPKGLRNRALQCRRAWFVLGSANAPHGPGRIRMAIPNRTARATASLDCVTSCAC